MKQSLQLRLGQQLTMTPQLQQAIRLLQLSTLDLQLEIQQALDTNMMLEAAEEWEADDNDANSDPAEPENTGEESEEAPTEELTLEQNDTLPDELPVDSDWEDTYDTSSYAEPSGDGSGKDFLLQGSTSENLHDLLLWQLELTTFSPTDQVIARAIIESINEEGYLLDSLEEIRAALHHELNPLPDIEEMLAVLHRVQHFDPPGVAARNLQECLLIQLNQLPPSTPWRTEAQQLVCEQLEVLAAKDYTQLTKKLKITREELQEIIALIQNLSPRPGVTLERDETRYIAPDVFVKKIKNRWRVELNNDITPRLRINTEYVRMIPQVRSRTDADTLKTHLQEARWFIKSLQSRHETLLKVTQCIVDKQSAFLDYGDEAMKPLILHDISSELNMHESTISRVTTQKYIHTPRGIYELKYFFSSHVNTDGGGECSSTAIRALIKKLVAGENATKPLSDNRIAKELSVQGIRIARRTVAKYRESMMIPPSNERKGLV